MKWRKNPTKIECEVPEPGGVGVDVRVAIVIVDDDEEEKKEEKCLCESRMKFGEPVVTNVSKTNVGGKVMIDGRNFGSDVKNVKVEIDGIECGNVEMVVQHNRISCQSPSKLRGDVVPNPQNGFNLPLVVRVAGQSNSIPSLFSFRLFFIFIFIFQQFHSFFMFLFFHSFCSKVQREFIGFE